MKLNKFKSIFKSALFVPIIFVIALSIPHLFQKPLTTDEGIYAAVSNAILNGKELYKDTWDHKPPLIFVFYTPVSILGPESGMFLLRLLAILINILFILILYKVLLALKVGKKYIPILLCIAAFFVASQIFEGNSINSELLFMPLIALFLLRILSKKTSYFEGFLLALGFLIKFQAFAEMLVILIAFVLIVYKNTKKLQIKNSVKVLVGFGIPIIICASLFAISGTLKEAIFATFTVNFGYVDQFNYAVNVAGITISRNVIIFIVTLLVVAAIYIKYFLYNKNKSLSDTKFLILNIIIFEVFIVLYPQRNYAHYLLQTILTITFGFAYLFNYIRNSKNIAAIFSILFLYTLFGFLFLLSFTVSDLTSFQGLGNSNLIKYYYNFFEDGFTGTNKYSFFYDYNNNQKFADYINANYKNYASRYLYTSDAEVFTTSNLTFTNKYYLYLHMYFTPQMFEEEKFRMLNSKVIFIKTSLAIRPSLIEEIKSKYNKVEEFGDYTIYLQKVNLL